MKRSGCSWGERRGRIEGVCQNKLGLCSSITTFNPSRKGFPKYHKTPLHARLLSTVPHSLSLSLATHRAGCTFPFWFLQTEKKGRMLDSYLDKIRWDKIVSSKNSWHPDNKSEMNENRVIFLAPFLSFFSGIEINRGFHLLYLFLPSGMEGDNQVLIFFTISCFFPNVCSNF